MHCIFLFLKDQMDCPSQFHATFQAVKPFLERPKKSKSVNVKVSYVLNMSLKQIFLKVKSMH